MATPDLSNNSDGDGWASGVPSDVSRWLDVTLAELPAETALIVAPTATVGEAIALMNQHDRGAVIVMEGSHLVGIFTERDVVRRAMPLADGLQRSVRSLMTPHPCVLTESTSFAAALSRLSGPFHHLPVINALGTPTKLVSLHSIVAYVVESFSDEIRNNGLERGAPCARASGQWPANEHPTAHEDEDC